MIINFLTSLAKCQQQSGLKGPLKEIDLRKLVGEHKLCSDRRHPADK